MAAFDEVAALDLVTHDRSSVDWDMFHALSVKVRIRAIDIVLGPTDEW